MQFNKHTYIHTYTLTVAAMGMSYSVFLEDARVAPQMVIVCGERSTYKNWKYHHDPVYGCPIPFISESCSANNVDDGPDKNRQFVPVRALL